MDAYKGVDVSSHNTGIDWDGLYMSGVRFAIVRAGLGKTGDTSYKEHVRRAHDAGIACGAYWFCYALTPAQAVSEADRCAKVIAGDGLELPVFYDFEYDTERYAAERGKAYTNELRTEIIAAFCRRMQALGYRCGAYLNPDYLLYKVVRAKLAPFPLWLASWRSNAEISYRLVEPGSVPTKYGQPACWQFGASRFASASGSIDVDYAYIDVPERAKSTAALPEVGGTYTIPSGAIYANGKPVPARYIGRKMTVRKVQTDRVMLTEIWSWVML